MNAAAKPLAQVERGHDTVRTLLGPLLTATPQASGFRLVSWDAEQGISLVFGRGDRFVLIEVEARDEALDCYARTRRFNVCARSQFTADGDLTAAERGLVDAVVRFLAQRERGLVVTQAPTPTRAQVREIRVDRLLIPEGADRYYLNPYAGCMIGCSFCYVAARADFSRRLDGSAPPAWGRWVDVKVNAAEVLASEVRRAAPGLVRMSPILTDPYQPVERRYRVTRRCLDVLRPAGFKALILTRESRVLDDLPRLTGGWAAVGFSIPTDDDQLRRVFEPGADTIDQRLDALGELKRAGVTTCAVIQPALPTNVERFVERLAPLVGAVRIDRLHFGEHVANRFVQAGAAWAASLEYQLELVQQLKRGFESAGVIVDPNDDLTGIVERLLQKAD